MNFKTGIAVALLLFAAGSAAYVIAGGGGRIEADGGARGSGMTVYFFDTGVRCDTCIKIEGYAHQVVTERFAEDYNAGRIGWMKLDLDAPEHAHFAEDFGLYTKSVVLVRHDADGAPAQWENLDRVWDLVYDKPAYDAYIEESIRRFRGEDS